MGSRSPSNARSGTPRSSAQRMRPPGGEAHHLTSRPLKPALANACLSLTATVVELLERGLDATDGERSAGLEGELAASASELGRTRARLTDAEARLEMARKREQTTTRTYKVLAERARHELASCPQCRKPLRGYDLLVSGRPHSAHSSTPSKTGIGSSLTTGAYDCSAPWCAVGPGHAPGKEREAEHESPFLRAEFAQPCGKRGSLVFLWIRGGTRDFRPGSGSRTRPRSEATSTSPRTRPSRRSSRSRRAGRRRLRSGRGRCAR